MSFFGNVLRGIGRVVSAPSRAAGRLIGGDVGRFVEQAGAPGGIAMAPERSFLESGGDPGAAVDTYRNVNLPYAEQGAALYGAGQVFGGMGGGAGPGGMVPSTTLPGGGTGGVSTPLPPGAGGGFLRGIGRFVSANPELVANLAGTAADVYGARQQGSVLDRQLAIQEEDARQRQAPRIPFNTWRANRPR